MFLNLKGLRLHKILALIKKLDYLRWCSETQRQTQKKKLKKIKKI